MILKYITKFNDEYQKIAADRHRHPHVDMERETSQKVAAIPRLFGMLDPANRKVPAQVIAGAKRKRNNNDSSDLDEDNEIGYDQEGSDSGSDAD